MPSFDGNVRALTVPRFQPASAQASFTPYMFAACKCLLQVLIPLESHLILERDNNILSVTLTLASLHSHVLHFQSFDKELTDPQTFYVKKAKRNPLVEVGTKIRDASMDEWLQSSSSLVYLFSGSQSSSCNCPLTSHCLPYDGDDQGN
ncbi:hypothetical protein SAY87_022943 [Trapa incisa]|uniref:Uncharacterized protein n=1 Tax=Trapa incisa TaxID=236973 RepID=A0AAN7Q5A5_9MYRT|nr:hypothetical protein SAY87_022943 [Trapa incisa]